MYYPHLVMLVQGRRVPIQVGLTLGLTGGIATPDASG
jgi:hypothetical protein